MADYSDIASVGAKRASPYNPAEMFANWGGLAIGVIDYAGITYEKIEAQQGVFWPCPDAAHPGTPRLFEPGSWNPVAQGKGPFYFPDGRAHFNVARYSPPAEEVDDEYPLMLTTGRVVSQFLSGEQTLRIGPLLDTTRSRSLNCIPPGPDWGLPTVIGTARRGVARSRCRRMWSRRFALTLSLSPITGRAAAASIN